MSDPLDDWDWDDCPPESHCVKKGNGYVAEKSYEETYVMNVAEGEQDGKCKCGPSCSCVTCTCGGYE